jgi:hypothetical protein
MSDYLHVLQYAAQGATCTVAKREHDWLFTFGDLLGLAVGCPWRILSDAGIMVSNEDEGQLFGLKEPVSATTRANALLAGRRLIAFVADTKTADLKLSFDAEVQLQVFNNSSGYEGWQASYREGERSLQAIGMGGGGISFLEV